ncbi:MAG: DUF4405 domain-containing protein [Bacteroidales bacterium]|nr:DUF4405 domain-containing protein [Bacteroidales bacterium]
MKKKFSWRSFISFGLFFSFFIILFSGVILYIAPAGRVANWTNWKLIGFGKSGWQSIHTVFSYTFVILSLFHLFSINWKAFLTHIWSKTKKGLNRKAELITSIALTLVIFFGVVYGVPPFQTVMDWGEKFTEGWEKEETAPPVAHAEAYSLERFADEILKMPVEEMVQRLTDSNIVVADVSLTLAEIGEQNNLAPQEIFSMLGTTHSQVEKTRAEKQIIQGGNGIGRKTIRQIGEEYGIPAKTLVSALQKAGIKSATNESVLKDLADANNMEPAGLLEIMNNRNE